MLKKILILFVVILAAFLGYVAFQPNDHMVFREITINKSPDVVFPYINNPKLMDEWSPWLELDPKMQMTYSGPSEGVGAKASWDSTGDMGTGSATVTESVPNELVKTHLEFAKPFVMEQEAQISIKNVDGQSLVTWSVKGKNNFIGKIFCVLMNGPEMIGKDFDRGLTKLKGIVEK